MNADIFTTLRPENLSGVIPASSINQDTVITVGQNQLGHLLIYSFKLPGGPQLQYKVRVQTNNPNLSPDVTYTTYNAPGHGLRVILPGPTTAGQYSYNVAVTNADGNWLSAFDTSHFQTVFNGDHYLAHIEYVNKSNGIVTDGAVVIIMNNF